MTVHIRPEAVDDRPEVQRLITAAFAPADHAGGPVAETTLNEQLRRDPAWIPELTLVAVLDGVIVGQLTCSYGILADSDGVLPDRRIVGVGPVAVLPRHQGMGIGSSLMRALVSAADTAGEPVLVLLGSPDFYGHFGFVSASELRIQAPDPGWGKYFQARPLSTYDPGITGRYRYAAPFDGL